MNDRIFRDSYGFNPEYFDKMRARRDAQSTNRDAPFGFGAVRVPKQPSLYVPHYGAKEAAKYAARAAA